MPIRQLGGFRSPATNPLAPRATTAGGLTLVQSQGSFDTSTVGQARAAGQWATDPYAKDTTVLLQSDGVANAGFNSTVIDSSSTNATSTIFQGTGTGSIKFNQAAINPFNFYSQAFINTCSVTYSSIGLTLSSSTTATIEGWMYLYAYPLTTTTFKNLVAYANTTTGIAWSVGVTNTGYATVFWNDGANNQATGSQLIPLNKWVFVQFVFNGGAISMGVNGVQDSAVTGTTTLTNPTGTYSYVTGSERNNIAQYKVFDLRVSNVAREFYLPAPNSILGVDANTTLSTFNNGILVDESATNATLTPSATIPSASPLSPCNPTYGPSAVGSFYNGGNSALSVPTNLAYNPGASDFTLELFVYPLASLTGGLIGRRATTAAFSGINLTASAGTITATATVNGTTYGVTITSAAGAVKTLQWNHIAFVRSGNVWTLYINGAASGTPVTLAGTVPAPTAVFTTGASSAAFTDYISASYISNVRLVIGTGAAIAYNTVASIPSAPLGLTSTPANTKLLYLGAAAGLINISSMSGLSASSVASSAALVNTSVVRYGTGSASFSGTLQNAFTTVPNAQLDVNQLFGGDFTIEFWLYQLGTIGSVFAVAACGASATTGWSILIDTTNRLTWYTGNSASNPTRYTVIRQKLWTHFAFVRQGFGANNMTQYVNGMPMFRFTPTAANAIFTSVNAVGTYIGADAAGAQLLNGYIEDFRITKYARYREQFTPPPFGLGKQ